MAARGDAAEDEEEQRPLLTDQGVLVRPRATTTSFFLFVPPFMQRDLLCSARAEISAPLQRQGSPAPKREDLIVLFAFFLVVLNNVMQGALLYAVGFNVVEDHREWADSVIHIKDVGDDAKCSAKHSLCKHRRGQYTCGPKGVQLMDDWRDLDLDGDGVWTEAEAADGETRDRHMCEFGVDTLIFYKTVLGQIQVASWLRERGLLGGNISRGSGIQKAYFDWFKGDIIMCAYGDDKMCGNMFNIGVFDEPMLQPGVSSFINSTHSAFDYCFDLLKPEGRCDHMMPSAYAVWKARSHTHCGTQEYESFTYTNPRDSSDIISLLNVDFSNRKEYGKTRTLGFLIFLWTILMIFFASLFGEFRDVSRILLWLYYFRNEGRGEAESDAIQGPARDNVRYISVAHRVMALFIVLMKITLLFLVAYVGYVFLISDTSYLNLLFDSVSIVFIIQVDFLLFQTLVGTRGKEILSQIEPMYIGSQSFVPRLYVSRSPFLRDFLWASLIIMISTFGVWHHMTHFLAPVRDALECACQVSGSTCFESVRYNREWWSRYWGETVPEARRVIEALASQRP